MRVITVQEIAFTVTGIAQPKGSTRSFVITPKGGGRPRAVTTSDNPKGRGWQQTIANCAALELQRAIHSDARKVFETAAIHLRLAFYLPRPKALLTKTKVVQAFAHVKKPDLSKLVRCAEDALTGVVWTDDNQVIRIDAEKHYCASGEFPRAEIRITEAVLDGLLTEETREARVG